MTRKTHGYKTTKTANGFKATVTESTLRDTPNATGHYADTVIIKEATFPTRARATGWAQKWTGYLRHQEKFAA